MNRLMFKELTLNRISSAFSRRINDLPDAIAWAFPLVEYRLRQSILAGLHNKHMGERCFILANGPSLSTMDLSLLAGEITFGMNRIYLLFDKIPFVPTYYVCINELILDQYASEIAMLPMQKFLNWNRRRLFPEKDSSITYIRMALTFKEIFSKGLISPLGSGGTVTYAALQIAFFMGFRSVVLVGLDHSFDSKGTPNKIETRQTVIDTNHFHPDYFPKGSKWQLPDLRRSELAFRMARSAYEKADRKIIDATVGGKCDVFEKADYLSLF